MFLYWEGYEIDGSDTDFDIILPENKEMAAFVHCFLSMPIFDNANADIYYISKQSKRVDIDIEELEELLKKGDYSAITIDINCKVMDELSVKVQEKLYSYSSERNPHEEAFGKVKNPCMMPTKQKSKYRGEMTVTLTICPKKKSNIHLVASDAPIEGYVQNEQLFRDQSDQTSAFVLNVGPGFYYEYTMFIIHYLTDHFPSLGVAGGLDCSGGWTDGCTYADSIYNFEKVTIPVQHSVNNTLKRLMEYDIIRSYEQYYKNRWNWKPVDGFNMLVRPESVGDLPYILQFKEYVNFVERILENQKDPFSSICDTAAYIMLPSPDIFNQEPKVSKELQAALVDVPKDRLQHYLTGYLAFAMVKGEAVCELRINWRLKKYFDTLIKLKDAGLIEFIKTVTYDRRHK